jgi:hypothetical protein
MIFLELIEAYLQMANTLGEMIDILYDYYSKSIFVFFLSHPTFYFVLCVALYLDTFNFYIIIILFFKTLDLFFKVEMIKQRYQEENMDSELVQLLSSNIAPWMRFIGLFTYVPLLFMAISS